MGLFFAVMGVSSGEGEGIDCCFQMHDVKLGVRKGNIEEAKGIGTGGRLDFGDFILATPVDGNAGVNQKNGVVVADSRLRTNEGLDPR
jgi:hypothetical protein